jgi:hypothetical protein
VHVHVFPFRMETFFAIGLIILYLFPYVVRFGASNAVVETLIFSTL